MDVMDMVSLYHVMDELPRLLTAPKIGFNPRFEPFIRLKEV